MADASRAVIGWAAERQADILLYVGAFLLSVAAIIFVAYQGTALSGTVRFCILSAYAVGFLGLGLALHRWERVREAAPVFLALGAILVPVDFIALRTQLLGEKQLPFDVLWLLGSSTCSALYFLLAIRGYGRLYALPGIPSSLAAWGSLGSVMGLPWEWFGPWFEGAAAAIYLAALALATRWKPWPWLLGLAVAVGGVAIAFTHGRVLVEDADPAALPAAYLLATVAVAGGLRLRIDLAAVAATPVLASLAVGTGWWAAYGLEPEWAAVFVAGGGLGYLVIAHLSKPEWAQNWASVALSAGAVSLLVAHGGVAEGGDHAALPVTYGMSLAGAAAACWRWRWPEATALLPPLAALTTGTGWWAAYGLEPEWAAVFVAGGGLGYLVIAHLSKPEWARSWAFVAMIAGAAALLVAHSGVADGGDHVALPVTYGMSLAGAAAACWRWRWPEATAPLPPLATLTAGTGWWAAYGLEPEWAAVFVAGGGLGYLVIAHLSKPEWARNWASVALTAGAIAVMLAHAAVDDGGDRAALPIAYAAAFVGASGAYGRWRWAEAAALLPPAGMLTVATAWWASEGLAIEWYGLVAAIAAVGYLLLAAFDRPSRRPGWQWSAAATAALGLGLAHATAAGEPVVSREALPITYGVVLASAAASFVRWRWQWRMAPASIPPLLAMTVATTAWAGWQPPFEWYLPMLTVAAAGYVAFSMADSVAQARNWLTGALASGAVVLAYAHLAQSGESAEHAALPVTYGPLFVVAAIAVARWRLRHRPMVAALPVLAAGLGASTAWAAFDMRLEWLSAWAAAAAVGYLVPAAFDESRRRNWRIASLIGTAAALYAAHSLAARPNPVEWQLPVAYAIAFAGAAWDALRERGVSVLFVPALGAMLGVSTMWAADLGPEWWAYAPLAVALLMVASHPWWARFSALQKYGWAYAVALSAGSTLAVLPAAYGHPIHGVTTQTITAALLTAAAFGARGTIAIHVLRRYPHLQAAAERVALVQAAFAFVYGASASLNGVLEASGYDRTWSVAAVGSAAWVLVAAFGRRTLNHWTLAPAALAGMTIAAVVAAPDEGALFAVLTCGTVAPLVALATTRRLILLAVANSFFFLAVWAGWDWYGGELTWLPAIYAGIATVEWALLVRFRRYSRAPRDVDLIISYLSWVPWLVSATVAGILLAREQDRLAAGDSLVETEQWVLCAAVLAMASAAVAGEGARMRLRWVWIPGSAGILAALLMGIATWQPSNVQAYTAPVGVYLVFIGLTFRVSPPFVARHMALHEAVMLVGMLHLILPPAEQSFEPGGGVFGLELLGIGVALLLVGLVLHARWLVPASILTLTGVGLRMVTGGMYSVPYWLLLGLAGTALLGFGFLVLLERERWDRFRAGVVTWWTEASRPGGPLSPPLGPV